MTKISIKRKDAIAQVPKTQVKKAGAIRSWLMRFITSGQEVAMVSVLHIGTIYVTNPTKFLLIKNFNWQIHEAYHILQLKKYGRIKFMWIYVKDFCKGIWKYKNITKAYQNISLEIEAREVSG